MKSFLIWLLWITFSLAAFCAIMALIFGSPFILAELGVDKKWAAVGFLGFLVIIGLLKDA